MNLKFTLFTFIFALVLFNCKQQNTFSDYQYTDKPQVISCEGINAPLYNEALYSFEDDILKYYQQKRANNTLAQSYSQFLREAIYNRIKLEDVVTKHTIDVFEALKTESDLWDAANTKSHLNYSGKPLTCIATSLKDENLKTTLNALITTNSMSPKLFGTPLISKYRNAMSDKYLALYIALDLYYSNLFELDLSKINLNKPEPKVDFNKVPQNP
ncbi:hypothetical protein [Cognatitamlana onchidii]|uniref:hypothetical protein n=1 Tax=Cognatitamlana onchidii TaxID=2562860 RepID=UPI0010A611B4|nr:hypothetical protein [Algibacter onchidii]